MTFPIANPAHPGEVLREDVLPHFRLSVTDAADRLRVSRVTLSRVLNGQAGLTDRLAAKAEAAFGVDAQLLLAMQAAYDLDQVRRDPEVLAGVARVPEPA